MIRQIGEIKNRKLEVETKLQVIEQALEKELNKSFFERNVHLCGFLEMERKIYTEVLSQLIWIINEKAENHIDSSGRDRRCPNIHAGD